jgi:hypothetical protein
VLLGTVAFLALNWRYIPDQIPVNFSVKGELEGYGSKASLLQLPLLNTVAIASLSFSKTIRISTLKRTRRIPAPPLLSPLVCLPLTLGIAYLTVCAALSRPLGAWFFPVFLAATILPATAFGVYLIKKST